MRIKTIALYSFFGIQIIGGMLAYIIHPGGLIKIRELKTIICTLAAQREELKNTIAKIHIDIHHWQQYPFFREQLIRTHLHMIEPGDIVYTFGNINNIDKQ